MTERAAHLVEYVFPDVPVRQWVLTLPPRVRYVLAWDHALCRAVVGVYMRAVLRWLRQRARARGVRDGRGGAVVIVQRFGSALNLNVHIHAMVMDGVFARDARGDVRFHAARYPATPDVTPLLVTLARRIGRLLARHGVSGGAEGVDVADPWAEETPTLAGLAAAAVCGVAALGPRAGLSVSLISHVTSWGSPFIRLIGDALDPSIAPGTESPEAEGLSYTHIKRILQGLAPRGRMVGLDLVEVNPYLDHAELTQHMAAQLLIEAMATARFI